MITNRFAGQRKGLLVGAIAGAMLLLLSIAVVFAQGPQPRSPRRAAVALGTGFTYQGQLKSGSAAVNGSCDLAFRLYDDPSAGSQIGNPITSTIPITGGLFTTQLNAANEFGPNAFNGDGRWLEIRVSTTCPSSGAFTTLSPREPISPAPYALTALKVAYKNVLVVAKSGGHASTIGAALASITDNSAENRYLVYVAPGTYTETVIMKPYVDIEGAGELATKITVAGSGDFTGTVVGADNAELRFLTVENTGGDSNAVAILNSSASPRLTHVTANASGGTFATYGIANGSASSPVMNNVTASAVASGNTTTAGVSNASSSPVMNNVTASGSGTHTNNYGVYNISSAPVMNNVTASAAGASLSTSAGVYNLVSSPAMNYVTASAVGGANGTSYGVYNISSASVTMNNVSASASGAASTNYGVSNSSSSPTMTNIIASARGGGNSYGVDNESNSAPAMKDVTASATGGITNNVGVNNSSSSPAMTNVKANASGGSAAYGVFNQSSSSPVMNYVTANATGASSSDYGVDNDHSSPLMNYVTAVVSASNSFNAAVNNYFASPTINNSTASVTGGFANTAISNQDSSPTLTNVTASATGSATQNIGINNDYATITINNSTISAGGATTNWGIHNFAVANPQTVQVNGSQVSGSTTAILNEGGCTCTVLVGASQLIGGVSGAGTFKCVASYNASYVSSGLNTCP